MSNIFQGESKGEIATLRDQLDGNDPYKREQAAKKCVALMRAGENVQSLFASMLRCVKTPDIKLKRLTYLYLVQYSTQEPEQAIMAVNTFIQDCSDPNPIVRALAIRTMARIKLENVAEHMIAPLKKALTDFDPYVRKTAVFSVAQLYDFVPEAIENAGLFNDLLKLLKDDNPMVVSNTTAAIIEINERRTTPIFNLDSDTIGPILSAISSCSENCQTILLDALAKYAPASSEDAPFLIDRLIPFLKHSNPAVVIGAFKCIFQFMDHDKRNPNELLPQIIPPFITLVTSSEYEVQYVILRTLSLFVLKYPKALSKEIRVFFCKYNDPSYIKMEKLDIIVTICRQSTAQLVLNELQEYSNSVDVAFVQKSIKCIGQIAIKIEAAACRCVDILVGLVQGKADYALEESIIVMTDILRKYPGVFESVIGTVCHGLENIKAPRAKAAGIWILGEYCHIIENVDMLLDPYLDTFHDEEALVQLQILSSLVKVYVERPEQTKDQLQFILTEATKDGNVPDVKNRALVYWRLLSSEASIAKDVVVFPKDTVSHSGVQFSDDILEELIKNMGTVSGVLHIVPADFVRRVRFVPEEDSDSEDDNSARNWHATRIWVNGALGPEGCQFLDLYSDYDRSNIYLRVVNKVGTPITGFQFLINSNALGMTISGQANFPETLEFGAAEVKVPIKYDQTKIDPSKVQLQIAMNTSMGPIYGTDSLPLVCATQGDGKINATNQDLQFKDQMTLEGCTVAKNNEFASRNIFVVGRNNNITRVTFSTTVGDFLCDLQQDRGNINILINGSNQQSLPLVKASARELFSSY
ncbi:Adaptin N terminal region family protein [Trichomonas vaginalis G3]|uniref:Adaptin N terminal region family protein n=1 Tax=Trichomonas vaginalis (strain ATCC PRA-98 / G3) TaxID=412133 RepID=A2ETI3_TRIV3|nr:clathrin binding [Trichomonas vaginalis G3]EAY04029.1 Adaptin N terminal region family protein [Trichomonas vaginalis G3]KAI5539007.1 clathrin binding [Trichomonas vaginalis G3]|eukprot:XP_001316252.1 Adaptin N terminal region family protein [Trichomonas vaginalis G3]